MMLRHGPQLHELEELADLDEPLPSPLPATCTMSAARKASMRAMSRRRGNVAGTATAPVAFVLLPKDVQAGELQEETSRRPIYKPRLCHS
jgi:hypothetical protein